MALPFSTPSGPDDPGSSDDRPSSTQLTASAIPGLEADDRPPMSERAPDSSDLRAMVRAIKSLSVDEAPVLARLAAHVRDFFRMEVFVTFNVLPGPRHQCVDFLYSAGLSPQAEHALAELFRWNPAEWGPFALHLADESQRNRVVCVGPTPPHALVGPGYGLMQQLGLDQHWQLRAWICDGPDLLAWIGGFRRTPFTGREQFLLSALIPALIPRLSWERQSTSAKVMMAGLTAALEALPYAAFIVRESEAIMFANDSGKALLREQGGQLVLLQREAGMVKASSGFDLKPLNTPGFGAHYLVTQSQLNVGSRMEALRVEWDLTRRQREVLGLLVQGDSNRAIASKLGCALRTAELHVSNVIRKAGVHSRTELTARFWGS